MIFGKSRKLPIPTAEERQAALSGVEARALFEKLVESPLSSHRKPVQSITPD